MGDTKNNEQDIEIAKTELNVHHMRVTVDKLAALMEGKDGVIARLASLSTHSKIQWGFITLIIGGLLYGRFG